MSDSDTDTQVSIHNESPSPQNFQQYLAQLAQEKDPSPNEAGDNTACIICGGKYHLSKEKWLRCRLCQKWAHKSCGIPGNLYFFCNNCF